MWWKKNKWKIIIPVAAVAVLAFSFWFGGDAPGLRGWSANGDSISSEQEGDSEKANLEELTESETPTGLEKTDSEKADKTPESDKGLESRPGGTEGGMTAQEKLDAAAEIAESSSAGVKNPAPKEKPLPVEPEDMSVSDKACTCTLSISCATILDHMDWLDPEKTELVPENGWILKPTDVTFYEGESVFNVLQRTCKQEKIHMEFENTPMYNSAYIEGIHNLYEFDCGELSGWMYKVNDWFPNYGCSRYQLKDGDIICWEYTCDLGVDIGGYAVNQKQ